MHEYLPRHLENAFWKAGNENVLTWNQGGRTKIPKTRLSVVNSVELLEGVVLLIKAVLLCHRWARRAPNQAGVAHSRLIVASLTPVSITWEGRVRERALRHVLGVIARLAAGCL